MNTLSIGPTCSVAVRRGYRSDLPAPSARWARAGCCRIDSRAWAATCLRRETGSVGGGRHDNGMSENQAGGTDTRLALGPRILPKGPLIDVGAQAYLW
jgi:hypothetical protein